jgi:hypothetical protein
MMSDKPHVRYSKETRERAVRKGQALVTLDVDMRHLDRAENNRLTLQATGDPIRIIALRTAIFSALALHESLEYREEGQYECER